VPTPQPYNFEATRVSLSGSGIAFDASEQLVGGTRIELQLQLKPALEYLQLLGVVVGCDPVGSSEDTHANAPPAARWRLRVDFVECPDEQERLIHHVLDLQAQRLSQRSSTAGDS
jgi:hypothetical protein